METHWETQARAAFWCLSRGRASGSQGPHRSLCRMPTRDRPWCSPILWVRKTCGSVLRVVGFYCSWTFFDHWPFVVLLRFAWV
jgi:hypothetical protein